MPTVHARRRLESTRLPVPPPTYIPRHPQGTLLHRIVRDHYVTLRELSIHPDDPTSGLPEFVDKEFEAFLGCAALPRGFTRLRCDRCGHERLLG